MSHQIGITITYGRAAPSLNGLSGKLDLTAAEGIKALAAAASHQQWLAARHLTQGKLKDAIEALRKKLVEAMAYLEAQIDFPDEGDTAHLALGHVKPRVEEAKAQIRALAESYEHGRVASRGLTVALCAIFGGPVTGASMNPARSLAPALLAGGSALRFLPLYLLAPPVGAALAALCYELLRDGAHHAQAAPADLEEALRREPGLSRR